MQTKHLALALIVVALATSGTAQAKKKPTCPVPDGVKCMSTIDVYRATNNADRVTGRIDPAPLPPPSPTAQVVAPRAPAPSGPVAYRPAEHAQLAVRGDTLVVTNTQPGAAFVGATLGTAQATAPNPVALAPRQAEPFREPAKIMKVFVSAWQDEQGDLHLPEHIVTEIEPRRWSIGAPAPSVNDTFRLLELPGQEAAKDSRATTAATVASSQSGN